MDATKQDHQVPMEKVEAICDAVRAEVAAKFRDGIAKESATLAVNMVSFEVYMLAKRFKKRQHGS